MISFALFTMSVLYRSELGLSCGVSSGVALPRILFLASAYSASRWAKDFTCGEGRVCVTDDPKDPLLEGRFKIRICGGGAAGRESSWITIAVLIGERLELPLESLEEHKKKKIIRSKTRCKTGTQNTGLTWHTFLSDWFEAFPLVFSPFPKFKVKTNKNKIHSIGDIIAWGNLTKQYSHAASRRGPLKPQ